METSVFQPGKQLNEMQITLLRLFDRGMTDEQVVELRDLLFTHYSTMLKDEADRIATERGYTDEDFERILNRPS